MTLWFSMTCPVNATGRVVDIAHFCVCVCLIMMWCLNHHFPKLKRVCFFQELPATTVCPGRDPKKDVFEAEYWIAIKVIFQAPADCSKLSPRVPGFRDAMCFPVVHLHHQWEFRFEEKPFLWQLKTESGRWGRAAEDSLGPSKINLCDEDVV